MHDIISSKYNSWSLVAKEMQSSITRYKKRNISESIITTSDHYLSISNNIIRQQDPNTKSRFLRWRHFTSFAFVWHANVYYIYRAPSSSPISSPLAYSRRSSELQPSNRLTPTMPFIVVFWLCNNRSLRDQIG